jgi:hypothetical protein
MFCIVERGVMNEYSINGKMDVLEKRLREIEQRIGNTDDQGIPKSMDDLQDTLLLKGEEITDKLLKLINSDQEIDIDGVTSSLGITVVELQYLVDELVEHKLLYYTSEGDADITDEGKNYIRFRESIRSMGFID